MSLYDEIIAVYAELTKSDLFGDGTITLQNDSDGAGDFICKWNYTKPLPAGMKIGK